MLWDERAPGGRWRSWAFLLHPGPSLLVTLVFVAISGFAARAVPPPVRILELVGSMLPIQFAIGIVNDVADVGSDAIAQPYKPLVRGAMSTTVATVVAIACGSVGLATAATINPTTLALCACGLSAGLAYDLGLRRTVFSWAPWWGGIALVPLAAYAANGRVPPRVLVLIPLTALIALGLHFANAVPDVDADREAGRLSLPARLGSVWARRLMSPSIGAAVVVALALAWPLGQVGPVLFGAALALAAVLAVVTVRPMLRPFPLVAIATAAFAVAWLGTLPSE